MMKLSFLLLSCASLRAVSASQQNRELQLPIDVVKCDDQDSFGELTVYSKANPMPFCANYGVCKPDYADHPEQPCECPAGYAGPHCEYKQDEVPACNLNCQNNGICMVGATSWEQLLDVRFMTSKKLDHQYCLCREGFHGNLCEQEAEPCGADNFCYNGGNCVVIQKRDGTTSYNCDCTTAGDSKTAFAGEFCEYQASTFCAEGMDQNGRHFCVNGGTCKGESHLGCQCEDGFVGPLCEFVDQGLEAPSCNLQCQNHGICRKGAKDLSVLNRFGVGHRHVLESNRHLLEGEAYSEDFEHCVCPAGFAGLQCEFKVDVCPGGEHVCLNGGGCNLNSLSDNGVAFQCDCSSAKSHGSRFAGDFCEMESTEYCTVDRMRPQSGLGQDAFCTNGGACVELVQHGQSHPGCACQEGFFGDHCEYRMPGTNINERIQESFMILLLATASLLTGAGLYVIYKYSKKSGHPCMNLDAIDRSKAPSVQSHFGNPWRDVFDEDDDEGVLSLRSEVDDFSLSHHGGIKLPSEYRAEESFHEDEHQSSDSVFSDGRMSATSSVTIDADDRERDGIMRFDPQQLESSSFGSAQSDSLHLFNDSNDGSVTII